MIADPMKQLKEGLEKLLNTINTPIQDHCIGRLKIPFL